MFLLVPETLSKTFHDIKKNIFLLVKLEFGDSSSCYREKIYYCEMSLNPKCYSQRDPFA